MRKVISQQMSFGDGFIDASLYELDEELRKVDELLSNSVLLKPFEEVFDDSMGRPGTAAPKVVVSLEQAGEELLTFYRFPKSQWKSLRTTNAIERLNGEFRRRVKTQRLPARCARSRAFIVWLDPQRSDPDAAHRRMAGA
jgi:Transposase, Mutator family